MELQAALGIALLGIGGLMLGFNVSIALLSVVRPPERSISPIPLLGGLAVAIGMVCFPALRAWSWAPIVLDPGGLLMLAVSLWQQRREL